MSGTVWVVVREWMPARLTLRIALAGFVATVVGSFFVIEAENTDFFLFDPVMLNIVMFMALVGLTGSATAYGDQILNNRLPLGTVVGAIYGVLIAVGALIALQLFFNAFFVSGAFIDDPPWVVGVFVGLTAIGTLMSWNRYLPIRFRLAGGGRRWVRILGVVGVIGMVVFGAADLVAEIDGIFA
ncbi:MAG: hypothetical protein O3B84_08620 [Chloroflexi bacterium]|nr:hypothetical protein [Chloroflexota bacterium]